MIDDLFNDLEWEDYEPALYKACRSALARLDAKGVFGTGHDRDRFVLNVFQREMESEEIADCAKQCNPPAACVPLAAIPRRRATPGARQIGWLGDRMGAMQVTAFDARSLSVDLQRQQIAVTGFSNGEMAVYSWPEGERRFHVAPQLYADSGTWASAIGPDGSTLLASFQVGRAGTAGELLRSDLRAPADPSRSSARGEQVLQGVTGLAQAIAYSPDSTRVYIAADALECWQVEHEERVWQQPIKTVLFERSPDGSKFAVFKDDGVLIVSAATGEIERQLAVGDDLATIAWSPDGTRLAIAQGHTNPKRESRLFVVDAADGAAVWEADLWAAARAEDPLFLSGLWVRINGVDWSPDGKWLACARHESIDVRDAATGELHRTFQGTVEFERIRFMDDRTFVAAAKLEYPGPPLWSWSL